MDWEMLQQLAVVFWQGIQPWSIMLKQNGLSVLLIA